MKIGNKEKRLCGGKLIVTNFKKLDPQMFKPLYVYDLTRKQLNKELAICMSNGSIYINTNVEGYELVSGVFENIMPESRNILDGYTKEIKNRLPEIEKIKNFEDWVVWATTEPDKNKIVHVLTVLLIPLEIERRKIERQYYSKIRVFQS